jgi:hypothetical protein
VAYQNEKIALDVTKRLSYEIMEKTGGALKFAVAYYDTKFVNYPHDKDKGAFQISCKHEATDFV